MAWLRAVTVAEVTEKRMVPLMLGARNVAVYAVDGAIYATANVCTHQFALLTEGFLEDGCVECPLHQGRFDVRTGKALGAPVTQDIATYAVKVEDGVIHVDPDRPGASAPAPCAAGDNGGASVGTGERIVILGAGQAGARAAEAARQAGFAGSLTLVGEEAALPYERPFLSKEFLKAGAEPEPVLVLTPEQIAALDLRLVSGVRAERIDRATRALTLADGRVLSYDRLLIATGARPRMLDVPGADLGHVHMLRNLEDARALRAALAGLSAGAQVVLIGGGFIGLEIASAARAMGLAVTLLEREARLMARVLPEAAGMEAARRAEMAGVTIHCRAAVIGLDGRDGRVSGVMLGDGRKLPADLVVIGIGSLPNSEIAAEAGLAVRNGIVVDETGRTSDAAIWAAGDVALWPHRLADGGEMRLESWHNAQEQAISAGRAIAGQSARYDVLPWFWSDQFGGTIQVLGIPMADGRVEPVSGDGGGGPAFYCLDAERRVAAVIAFDNPAAIRRGRELIAREKSIHSDPTRGCGIESEEDMSSTSEADLPLSRRYAWPEGGMNSIPDWVYTDEAIYRLEVEKIFHGRTWNYVALEAEIPEAGDFVRSHVGPTPVVVVRGKDGRVNVFENRCAHRAAEFCRSQRGKAQEFVCPYHQWTYDLEGNLAGVPFRRGVAGKGGMPKDFRPEDHGVRKLAVTMRRGVVFASYAQDMESLEDYMGPEILEDFDATFDGRKLKILGYYRNTLPGNWKLYHENLKDPYHATLLHTFLVTFGLLVAGNKSAMISDATGRHGTMASAKSDGGKVDESARKEMRAYREGMGLNEPRFMDFVEEFDSPWSVTMQTIWPNLIVQREMNTLGVRQIVPCGPNEFIMNWTMFGFEGDDEEMTRHRLRQGNLMGPAGFLGLEDNEAIKFVQDGMLRSRPGEHLVALDPDTPVGTSDTLISESAIRGMYQYWRKELGL